MASLEEIRNGRLKKLAMFREKGIDPYPAVTHIDVKIVDLMAGFEEISAEKREITIGGRIMSLRVQGALAFFDLYDGTGKFQALLKKEEGNTDNDFDFFIDSVDIGDFVEVKGILFVTKRGQQSIEVKKWRMLSKSLLPLPEKWAGLQDADEKLRHRYLEFLTDAEARNLVMKKAKFWKSVRNFLDGENFLEVETPILETTTGGADAKPFKTHHNALDIDVFLRISAGELWQKELMIAGFPKVFEIGRVFRNEGMSAEHAQDYTQMEFYWAYADFNKGMDLVERLYKHVALETFGTLQFVIGEHSVDLSKEWEKYNYAETIKKYADLDIFSADISEIEQKLGSLKVSYEKKGWNRSRAIDSLWKYVRRQLSGPGFVVGVPKEVSPLAKTDEQNTDITQRFQPIIAGSELGNGYSELNDPIDQIERFKAQAALRDAGDDEAQMFASDFVEALEYGMPPTCGFGMSERLFAFLANKPIRETQLFPLLRPRE